MSNLDGIYRIFMMLAPLCRIGFDLHGALQNDAKITKLRLSGLSQPIQALPSQAM